MKNILLIGGSTGIGYELSKKLVDNKSVNPEFVEIDTNDIDPKDLINDLKQGLKKIK